QEVSHRGTHERPTTRSGQRHPGASPRCRRLPAPPPPTAPAAPPTGPSRSTPGRPSPAASPPGASAPAAPRRGRTPSPRGSGTRSRCDGQRHSSPCAGKLRNHAGEPGGDPRPGRDQRARAGDRGPNRPDHTTGTVTPAGFEAASTAGASRTGLRALLPAGTPGGGAHSPAGTGSTPTAAKRSPPSNHLTTRTQGPAERGKIPLRRARRRLRSDRTSDEHDHETDTL